MVAAVLGSSPYGWYDEAMHCLRTCCDCHLHNLMVLLLPYQNMPLPLLLLLVRLQCHCLHACHSTTTTTM